MKISQLLKIEPGMTALIGGGGKTTLMYRLAGELSAHGTVIICTSTKILAPDHIPVLTGDSIQTIVAELKKHRVICIGTRIDDGKLSAPAIGFGKLKEIADYVLAEADGAHRLPIKAHAEYEPVIPDVTDKTVLMIGADAFGLPIGEICHRPERFAQIAGVDIHSIVTPQIIANVIANERLGDCLYINKVENERALSNARKLAKLLELPVTAGSLMKEEYLCLR